MTQVQPMVARRSGNVRLGGSHGYRIDGDVACLNAEIAAEGVDSAAGRLALQLWACDAPYGGGALSGIKIAEAALSLSERSGEPQQLYAKTFARLPAGDREYNMVLVLAEADDGGHEHVQDFANYPSLEHFNVPSMAGDAGYAIEGDEATLRVDAIVNPRGSENLSGTLALELWALPEPYAGGNFTGMPLAGVELGRLEGQAQLQSIERRLALKAVPAGHEQCALMLREWTSAGYVTRDFRNFGLHCRPTVVEVAAAATAPVAPAAVASSPPDVHDDPGESAAAAVVGEAEPTVETRPSIQHASLEDLMCVAGLNRKLAAGIIKARPFRSFEDLLRVRGIGDKTLRRLRNVLRL